MESGGIQEPGGYPFARPFVLLCVYFAVSSLQLALVAARPPFADTAVTVLWTLAAVSVVLGAGTVVSGLVKAPQALPVLVALAMLVAAAATVVSVGGQGQLISGFYLAVLGVFTGYFFSPRTVRVLVVFAALTYGGALIVQWRLDSPFYVLAILVLVIGVTLLVSSLVQRLREEAVRDPLTGTLNRRGLSIAAQAIHNQDVRRGSESAVIEIDLDGFKAYNDDHGHLAGDRLLSGLVADWSTVLRRADILARTGGDEFVVLLPESDATEAEVLIARMREANPYPWSAGVTCWQVGESLPLALHHADEAMYQEKVRYHRSR